VTPLSIGVDARELLGNTTGVGRYLGELLRRWMIRADRDHRRFLLYAPEPLALAADQTVMCRTGGESRGTWWEQGWLRRQISLDKPSVFFAPAYSGPVYTSVPLAVTVHDVSFAAHPEWFRPREGLRRRWLTRHTARRAGVVFTDSMFSRDEIIQRLGVDPNRLEVIAPGVTSRNGRARPRADREPLVLYVGSLFNRRRVPDLIAAFARATGDLPAARLAIVGDDRTWPPLDLPAVARSEGVGDRTEFRRYVPDDELTDLYGRASVFAFLSEYEGFGLTPLEALTAGVPIVVLDTPVAREVYGPAACYVASGDIAGTAAALRRFLTSPDAAATQLAHAGSTLARYSWDDAAARTLAHLERIARR
jgi:glycosyltransferase involved in cell wall biosynthesis